MPVSPILTKKINCLPWWTCCRSASAGHEAGDLLKGTRGVSMGKSVGYTVIDRCLYIYIYIMYTYIHTYIYTYINPQKDRRGAPGRNR